MMTPDEARAILDRYANWNAGQKSVSAAFGRERTVEDDIYDERRALLLAATRLLRVRATEGDA